MMFSGNAFLAAFLGCMFANVIYTEGRSFVGAWLWRRKYGDDALVVPGPLDPNIGKMLDAEHELRMAALDLERDDLKMEDVSAAESKVIAAARAWRACIPPENAERMRNFPRFPHAGAR